MPATHDHLATENRASAAVPGLSGDDEKHLRRAIELAHLAVERGDHPFGCVIVRRRTFLGGVHECDVVVEANNTVHSQHDSTGHAELNGVRALGKVLARDKADANADRDRGVTSTSYELFTSTEPCCMCCGSIYWSFAISRVVFACSESSLARFTGPDFLIPSREIFSRGSRTITVEGPFLEDEAAAQHAAFWPKYLSSLAVDASATPN